MALSCINFVIIDIENTAILKSGPEVTQDHRLVCLWFPWFFSVL